MLIYTDGACLGNPGPGGWGLVALTQDAQIVERGAAAQNTTNNRMEIQAVIEALQLIANRDCGAVTVRSDSKHVLNGSFHYY